MTCDGGGWTFSGSVLPLPLPPKSILLAARFGGMAVIAGRQKKEGEEEEEGKEERGEKPGETSKEVQADLARARSNYMYSLGVPS